MARSLMQSLARWHIWLGWLVAVPLLLWTISGLFMVSFPIEQVRGTDLRAEPRPLPQGKQITIPMVNGWPVTEMRLVMRLDRPVWVIERSDGSVLVSDALTDVQIMEPISAALARELADAALKHPTKVATVRRFAANANPIDLRRARPAWQVHYADGTNVYIDADSGEVLAVRTKLWRAYDFMWGLHIMDPGGREDSHHPLLILSAVLALVSVVFGSALLFRRRRAKVSA